MVIITLDTLYKSSDDLNEHITDVYSGNKPSRKDLFGMPRSTCARATDDDENHDAYDL